MSEQEYLERKPQLQKIRNYIIQELKHQGFTEWWGGAGDWSESRIWKGDNYYEIWWMVMDGDYWENKYPDHEFYAITPNGHIPIENVMDLFSYMNTKGNPRKIIEK